MSVKAMGLVWDTTCPAEINGHEYKPGHKYVLLAYADHADHAGRNIYPAVATVARKTGYDERTVQRLTHEMETMGLLISDGDGPRGTNRFRLPYNAGGDKLSPQANCQGDKSDESLGDIPSGDIPSGVKLSPELKEINLNNLLLNNIASMVWAETVAKLKDELPRAAFDTWVSGTSALGISDQTTLVIAARNEYAKDWLDKRVTRMAKDASGYNVCFVVAVETEQTDA